jgi:hypothetical protein
MNLPRLAALLAVLSSCTPAWAQQVQPSGVPSTSYTIATGGTSVIAVTGPVRGCYIQNPPTAADQGIATAENGYVDPTKAATTAGNGSNGALTPGQPWNCPTNLQAGSNVWINAATSGHKFTVVVW